MGVSVIGTFHAVGVVSDNFPFLLSQVKRGSGQKNIPSSDLSADMAAPLIKLSSLGLLLKVIFSFQIFRTLELSLILRIS